MLDRTDAITNEVPEQITFVVAYPAVYLLSVWPPVATQIAYRFPTESPANINIATYPVSLSRLSCPTVQLCTHEYRSTHLMGHIPTIYRTRTQHFIVGSTRVPSLRNLHIATSELDLPHMGSRGGAVVEALRYKPEGCGFDSRWCHWIFSLT
jgi:hypothetical protein